MLRVRSFKGTSILMLCAMLAGCCPRYPVPAEMPACLDGSVWSITISREGKGLFTGLLACGMSGARGAGRSFHLSLMDSTGITLMRLYVKEGRLETEYALPPFDESRINGYIAEELGLFLLFFHGRRKHINESGMCSVKEVRCAGESGSEHENFGKWICYRGGSWPVGAWTVSVLHDGAESKHSDGVSLVVIRREFSEMEMRLKRYE